MLGAFSDTIYIQAQDDSGVWRTYSVTRNDTQLILLSMQGLKGQFPHYRVRAVTASGQFVDMLP
jgi:hypothetical protein